MFGRSLNPGFGNHYQSRCHRGHQQLGSWPQKFIYFLINWRAQILASDSRFAVAAAARVLNRSSNRSRLIIFQLEMLICSFQAIIRSNFLASCSIGGSIVLLGWFFHCWLPRLLANEDKMKRNCQFSRVKGLQGVTSIKACSRRFCVGVSRSLICALLVNLKKKHLLPSTTISI